LDEGLTKKEAAARLGITYGTMRQYFFKAGQEGWLVTPDLEEHLTFSTAHKVVANIEKALAQEAGGSPSDMPMTIEAAKGLGLFKRHEVVQNDQAPAMMALSVKIEQPTGNEPELTVGSVGGEPAYIDAD